MNYCNAFCMETLKDSMNERQQEIVNSNLPEEFFNLVNSMRLFREYEPEKNDTTNESLSDKGLSLRQILLSEDEED